MVAVLETYIGLHCDLVLLDRQKGHKIIDASKIDKIIDKADLFGHVRGRQDFFETCIYFIDVGPDGEHIFLTLFLADLREGFVARCEGRPA